MLCITKSASCTYGDRAFSIAALKFWNSLPAHLREIISTNRFKSKIKTSFKRHLFSAHSFQKNMFETTYMNGYRFAKIPYVVIYANKIPICVKVLVKKSSSTVAELRLFLFFLKIAKMGPF